MKDYIVDRTISEAQYIIDTHNTIRDAAKELGTSKSTIHKDLYDRLPRINAEIYNGVRQVMDDHIRNRVNSAVLASILKRGVGNGK